MRLFLALIGLALSAAASAAPPDLLLIDAKVWTGEAAQPAAEAVAITAGRIAAVGSTRDLLATKGPATRVIDLHGRRVVPGLIDAHMHFENAVQWFYEVRLMDVDREPVMLERLAAATKRVPKGMWITGTDWGGAAMRTAWKAGDHGFTAFTPSLAAIDRLTPDHPVMFQRHDGAVFVNSAGIRLLRVTDTRPDPAAGAFVRDGAGHLTGLMTGTAARFATACLPPRSRAATLIAARALMKELNSYGFTSIHDIARVDALSQATVMPVDVERSASDLSIFTDLRATGDLSVRVYPLLSLWTWAGLKGQGIAPGGGDEMIRYGALKHFIDGTQMFEPWTSRPDYSGDYTYRVVDPAADRAAVIAADAAGWDIGTHIIGDRAIATELDWTDAAIAANGPRDRRIRLIHMWYPRAADIARAGRLHAFAEITPMHLVREMDGIEKQIGPERAKTAFAWRSMIDAGLKLNIVSDWPGSFDKSEVAPLDPMGNIYMAVVRHGVRGGTGWHPEQALTITEALTAYTANPADSAHELAAKGTIAPGKLADIAVLSDDILSPDFAAHPEKLLKTRAVMTLLGGRVVYDALTP